MAFDCEIVDFEDAYSYPIIGLSKSWRVLINEGMVYPNIKNGKPVENIEAIQNIMQMIGEDPSCSFTDYRVSP